MYILGNMLFTSLLHEKRKRQKAQRKAFKDQRHFGRRFEGFRTEAKRQEIVHAH